MYFPPESLELSSFFFPFEDCGGKVGDVTREGNYVVRERYTYF